MIKFVCLDTETTGLDPKVNGLASIACISLDENLEIVSEFYTLVNETDKKIEQEALNINGLKIEDLKNAPLSVAVMNTIATILDDKIVICHNAAFDIAWLNNRGFNITKAIDTMDLSWLYNPGQKAKLGIVCERFAIPVENAHNSLGDTRMTVKLLKKFVENKSFAEKHNILEPKPINFDRWKKR